MDTRIRVRASLRFALLVACLGLTGTAFAQTGGQTAQPPPDGDVEKVGAGDRHVRLGATVRVHGAVSPPAAGQAVRLQRAVGRGWRQVGHGRTRPDGRFVIRWRPDRQGAFRLRVVSEGPAGTVRSKMRRRVYVYRQSLASWYGPGFYGRRTACGRTITTGTLGVANKSLPCGTRVTFRHRGRSVTVPVIDRGPYVGAREWDLTAATKQRLGFGSTGTIWTTR